MATGKKLKFTNYEGQKYEIKIRKPRKESKAEGLCYPPEDGGCAKILINPHQSDDDYNETIVHEFKKIRQLIFIKLTFIIRVI